MYFYVIEFSKEEYQKLKFLMELLVAYFPNVAPFMFGKNKSRKSKNERRYCGKGTKNRYLKRSSIFYLTRPQFLSFCGYDLNTTNAS